MMKPWQKAFFALLCCGIALIVVDKVTNWTLEYKLIIPGAILALGLLIAFWPTNVTAAMPKTMATMAPTAAAPAWTAPPKPATPKKTSTPGDGGVWSLLFGCAIIFGGLYLLIFQFVPWVNRTYESVMTSLPDHPPYISGITPIGHNATPPAPAPTPTASTTPVHKKINPDTFYKVLQPNIIYDVFYLYEKQIWEWDYLQGDLAYRVKATGNEPFTVLKEKAIRSQEWAAQYAGTLQIKTVQPGNRVRLIRYNRFDM